MIGLIVTIPLVLIGLVIIAFGYAEASKAYWDYRVKGMCEKDGGIKLYERVLVAPQYVDQDGNIRIPLNMHRTPPFAWEAKPSDLFYVEMSENDIKTGRPRVRQYRYTVYRSVDKKALGESTGFSRIGGDFPTFAHESSYACPRNIERDLFSAVFEKSK